MITPRQHAAWLHLEPFGRSHFKCLWDWDAAVVLPFNASHDTNEQIGNSRKADLYLCSMLLQPRVTPAISLGHLFSPCCRTRPQGRSARISIFSALAPTPPPSLSFQLHLTWRQHFEILHMQRSVPRLCQLHGLLGDHV